MGRARLVTSVLALVVLTAACGIAHPSELNFRSDKRLTFTSPKARTVVRTPLHVAWQIRDFEVAPPGSAPATKTAGYYAVFVDRAPIKPAQTMRDVAHNDLQCLANPSCPDATYLADRRIFTTTNNEITLDSIPSIPGDNEKVQLHTITVVLMDTSGHRIGESAWGLDIRMRKIGL